jgi:hypothetical protein
MRRERSVNPVVRRQLDLIQHAAKGGMLPVLDLDPGATSELANCRRVLHIVRNQPAAGGQTELPNGCGRLALRAYEEKRWRAAAIVAVLEERPGICSVVVAASSMIMIGIMLYNDWPQ